MTDLIDVQFNEDLSFDSCIAIIESFGVHFVDSSEYRHNLWLCALDDSIRTSPLGYGNALHVLDETEWACAQQYAAPELQSDPHDPYFVHQWHLKNTGQNGGMPDNDIDADSAWLVPLKDSAFAVAILDDGFTSHIDLGADRLLEGFDFSAPQDYDPSPWAYADHGMACMGPLAATLGDTGVVGVAGSSTIVPVRIFNDFGIAPDTMDMAAAIRFAARRARVISNSWTYLRVSPIVYAANAIRDVVVGEGAQPQGPEPPLKGCVMVFAAGNFADDPGRSSLVAFPANMPEVIAVGAINNQAVKWDYSCFGSALDVVAPSGYDGDQYGSTDPASNLWTIDQLGNLGWNPSVTGEETGETDDVDYTAVMGGTSGACPQVAGIVALIMARGHDDISDDNPTPDILEILEGSAEDLGSPGRDDSTGYGRANAYRALLSIIRGDVNNDAVIDGLDLNVLIDILYFGGHATLDDRTADLDCNGVPDSLDLNLLIDIIFFGAPNPQICFDY